MDDAASAFCELFPELYVRLCRRHDDESRRARLTPQQDAVLHHLAMSGPLTVGEMSRHFARAQSVVPGVCDRVTPLPGPFLSGSCTLPRAPLRHPPLCCYNASGGSRQA